MDGIFSMRTSPVGYIAASGGAALEIRSVAKRFGGVQALREVTISVKRGEFLALLGPSGSGKTTLLNLIAGFEQPSAGVIALDGRDISILPPYRREIGLVFQSYALFPHMTVAQNVAFPLRMRGVPRDGWPSQVQAALDLVRLGTFGERFPDQLSGGQQQRVALARAVVFNPALLLMDEPLGALDRKLREHMQIEIKQLQRALGSTVIYVTHDQGEALTMADRIAVMRDGTLQQLDSPSLIYNNPRNAFVADFIGETNSLKGRLCGIDGETASFVLDDIQLVGRASPELFSSREDSDAWLTVRPENVLLNRAAAQQQNPARGRVVEILFEGATTLYVVRFGATSLVARMPQRTAEALALRLGDEVVFGWNSDHAIVYGHGLAA